MPLESAECLSLSLQCFPMTSLLRRGPLGVVGVLSVGVGESVQDVGRGAQTGAALLRQEHLEQGADLGQQCPVHRVLLIWRFTESGEGGVGVQAIFRQELAVGGRRPVGDKNVFMIITGQRQGQASHPGRVGQIREDLISVDEAAEPFLQLNVQGSVRSPVPICVCVSGLALSVTAVLRALPVPTVLTPISAVGELVASEVGSGLELALSEQRQEL